MARRDAMLKASRGVLSTYGVHKLEHTKKLLWVPLGRVMPSRFNERRHAVNSVEEVLALI